MRSRFLERRPPASRLGHSLAVVLCGVLILWVLVACAGGAPAETGGEPSGDGQPVEEAEEQADQAASEEPQEPGDEVVEDSSPPGPDLPPDYSDISSLPSYVGNTPEETFERYLIDAIEQQVSIEREKLDMRLRYEPPAALAQELNALIVDINMIENRSRRTILRERDATFEVEIDVRVTYADSDTSTMTCAWTTMLEQVDEKWYVVTPRELLLRLNCV